MTVGIALVSLLVLAAPAASGGEGQKPPASPVPAPQAAPNEGGWAGAPPRDYDAPPQGSAADQALWQRAYDLDNQLPVERARSTRLQLRAKGNGLEARLEALAKESGAAGHGAEELLARLRLSWREDLEVLTSKWPVDPIRVCRYDLMTFESVMVGNEEPAKARQLAAARAPLLECVARAELVLVRMSRANGAFEAAIADVEKALAAAPGKAASASAAGASPGLPAAVAPEATR